MARVPKQPTDRRSFLVAAAAVTGAAPALARGRDEGPARDAERFGGARGSAAPSRFVIDLGGVHLPDAVAEELQAKIRRDVLDALAKANVNGEPQSFPLPRGLWGYVMKIIHGR